MAELPATSENDSATAVQETELPPEEQFWERYSPHHEFPLSTVSAVAVCGLVVGLLMLNALRLSLARQDEVTRPSRMDAVEIEGGGTNGPGGPGEGPLAPKPPKPGVVEKTPSRPTPIAPPHDSTVTLNVPIKPQPPLLEVPAKQMVNTDKVGEIIFSDLDKERDRASQELAAAMRQAEPVPLTPVTPPTRGVKPGLGGRPGSGGKGPGIGGKDGPGEGDNSMGVVLSMRRKREMRWQIDFSGSGEEHLDKLRALKITLAIPTPQRGIYEVVDLTRTPPVSRLDNLIHYTDKVKWINNRPDSMQQLGRALYRRDAPRYVIIFLPEAVEEEMVRLEYQFGGLPEHQIQLTIFEIRRRTDGSYGPVVVQQN